MKTILTTFFAILMLGTTALYAQHHHEEGDSRSNAAIDSVLTAIEHNNLQLQALKQSHEAEVLDMKAANTISGPSVEYSPFYMKGYHGMASSEFIVSEEVDFPTLYGKRKRQATLQAEALTHSYAAVRRDILLEAKLLCIDIIRLNQIIDMLAQRLSQSETMQQLFEKRMDAGDANILALNKAKLERLDVMKALAQAESERMELRQTLQALNGGNAIMLTSSEFETFSSDFNFDTFAQQIMATDANILAAEANVKASDHELSMSRQSWLPSLSLGYRRNTEQKDKLNGFLVGASFPLFRTSSAVNAAKKRQTAAQLQLDDARRQTESELQARYNEVMKLRSVLDHSDTELLRSTLSLLEKALQHGEITVLEYYTEVSDIYAKLETHINLHCQYCKIMAQLHKGEL